MDKDTSAVFIVIKTNNRWRPFKYRNEVPEKVLRNQFDYLSEDIGFDGFFKYRNIWYHVDEFMRVSDNAPFKGWDRYLSDSFFSGVLLRVSSNGERYMVGTYYS